MAHATLISILSTINDLLQSPRISITSSTREILHSAYDRAWSRTTLALNCCSEPVTASDEAIPTTEAARRLKDAIEFAVSTQLLHQSESCESKTTFSLNLDHLEQEIVKFAEIVKNMEMRIEEFCEQKVANVIELDIIEICAPRREEEASEMVGLRDEFRKFRDAVVAKPSAAHESSNYWGTILWISGMAGVGKTIFARMIYQDPLVRANFECWAFVRVGGDYSTERLFRSLHAQLNQETVEEGDIEEIRESLERTLSVKRYLIVLDDVRDFTLLDELLKLHDPRYPFLVRRILMTSRTELNFPYSHGELKLQCLNEEESWELLRRKVFVEEEGVCPPELVEPGKKIAKKCGGLPLLINAVAPLLLREAEKNPKSWNRVADRPGSILEEASHRISEIMACNAGVVAELHLAASIVPIGM